MDAYIRKLYNGFYYIVEGRPEDKHSSRVVDMPYNTRRQAMRYAKRDGYNVVIQGKSPQENEKKSLLDSLATAKQRVEAQKSSMQQTAAKSNPIGMGL